MPVTSFQRSVRIRILVGDETVTLICRQPTGAEVSRFLSDRFVQKGRKVTNRQTEARITFINAILEDVENAVYENAKGELLPLNASTILSDEDRAWAGRLLGCEVRDWRDLVNASWKATAAMRFEESQLDEEGAQGN
jgi:hypothetical protein